MKRWAFVLMLAAAALICGRWIYNYGLIPRLGVHDSYRVVLALLIGVPFGAATGYFLRDRVLLCSFLAALPAAMLLFIPTLLFQDVLQGIVGTTTYMLIYCGSAYFVNALLYKVANFAIYRNASGAMVAVGAGWSWPAFFFGAFWALFNRMWLIGLGTIAVVTLGGVGLAALAGGVARPSSEPAVLALVVLAGVTPLVIGLIYGAKGNSWRQQLLLSRTFNKVGTAVAKNPRKALAAWSGADGRANDGRAG